jgi:hypothetical protein
MEGLGRLVRGESHSSARHLFARDAGRTQAERGDLDVWENREKWRAEQPTIPPEKAVFIDAYSRSLIGTRLIENSSSGRWKTTTFLSAMRAEGFIAPLGMCFMTS